MKLIVFICSAFALSLCLNFAESSPFHFGGIHLPGLPKIETHTPKDSFTNLFGKAINTASKITGGIVNGIAGLAGIGLKLLSGFLRSIGGAAWSLANLLKGLPGGLPEGIVIPDLSGLNDVKDANKAIITLANLIEVINEIFKRGNSLQINALLSDDGLLVILPKLLTAIETLISEPGHLNELNVAISIDSIRRLFSSLNSLKINIQANISVNGAKELIVIIDKALQLLNGVSTHLFPTLITDLVKGLRELALILVGSLQGIPGGLPSGLVITDISLLTSNKITDANEAITIITKLFNIFNEVLINGNSLQINACLDGKTGLQAILPKLIAFLKSLLSDKEKLLKLNVVISIESMSKLYSVIGQLGITADAKMPNTTVLIEMFNEAQLLINKMTSFLYPYLTSSLISNLKNVIQALLLSITNISTGLPVGIKIPEVNNLINGNIVDANEAFYILIDIFDVFNAILTQGNNQQINALLTEKDGIQFTLPKLVALLKTLISNQENFKELNVVVSYDTLKRLGIALGLFQFNIPHTANNDVTLILNKYIKESQNSLNKITAQLYPEIVAILIKKIGNLAISLSKSIYDLPGGLPSSIIIPDVSILSKQSDPNDAFDLVTKIIQTYNQVLELGDTSQIYALISNKDGLLKSLPNIIPFLESLLSGTTINLKTFSVIISGETLNNFYSALTRLRVNIETKASVESSKILISIIDKALQLLKEIKTITFPQLFSGLIKSFGNLALSLVDSFTDLPGGLPNGIIMPDVTIFNGSNLPKINVAFNLLIEIFETFMAVLNKGNPLQITAVLTGKNGLQVKLTQIITFLNDLSYPANLKSLNIVITLGGLNKFYTTFALIKENIIKTDIINNSMVLTEAIDNILTLVNQITSTMFPDLNYYYLQELRNLGTLLINSFNGLPEGLPTGITIPNGDAKLTNLDDAFVFVANLLETYPAAVKHLNPLQISDFLTGKGGLKAILPIIVDFFKDLIRNPAHLISLKTAVSLESLNKLHSALTQLREVVSFSVKLTAQIDETLTLLEHFASHLFPVPVSVLIEGIANIGALLVNSFTGLPGGLPTGITIPNGNAKLTNLDEAFVFVAKLLETYPAAVKHLSPSEISAFLSGKGGLEAVLPNIVAFLKDLLRNPAQLKSLKTAVSLESINKLHSALTQLREVVSFSVKLTAQIDETLTLLEHFASHLFPVPVSELIEGIANIGALLVNSFTGLPGGLPTGITIPNGNAKLTNLDEAFVFVAKLLETYPAAVKHLSPSEISAFLSGKGGLEAVLPNIVAFLKDLLRNPAQLKSLKTAVSLESINKLHSALTQLREVVSFSVKLTAQIDETLTLLEHFASHLFPVPVSVLIEGIANIGALLVNSFTGLPGGLPTGITIPNGNAKLTNLDEAFVFVAKLLETYPVAVKHLSPSEISAFLSGKGGLEAVLPNIVAFLKDLLRNPAQLKSLKTAVSLESLNKLHSALTQLREVVSFSVKLTAQIDETLTLLEHFASHLFHVPVSELIEGIANIGALLVNSFTGLPGGLPTGITIPNGNAKLTNLDEAFVFVAKLLETYPAAVKHLSPSEISAFLSGKGGLEAVLPNIVAFLKDLLRNPAQLKSLKTAVSLESINKLHSALTQLREVVSFSVKLTAQIDETLTLLEHFASHLFPVPVSELIEGIANIGALLVNSFTGLPGGLPTGITIPNGNAKLTNLDEAFVFVAKLLETYPAAVKHLSPSEISAFLSGKGGLEAVLPNIVAFLKDLLRNPAQLKSLKTAVSLESINKLHSALTQLREVVSFSVKLTAQIDETLTLLEHFASHLFPVSVSELIEGIANIGALLVNSFTGLPEGLPTGITIPNGNAKLTNLDEAFVFVAKLLETYPVAVKHLSPSEISAFLSGKGGLEAVLPNIVAFLKDLLRNPAQLKSLKTAVSLESLNKLHSALTQLREVVSFSVKLTAQIDETLTLLEHFASHLFPVPVSVLIEGIANIGALLVNSFTGLPGGLPTGITIPNGNAKLTNLDEAFVFVAKLLETYPAAVKHLSPSEISAFLSGKGGLEAVLPNIVAFLKDLLRNPAQLKSLKTAVSLESINKLHSALTQLREVVSFSVKLTAQIDETLTLLEHFASHLFPVPVSVLIEGIANIGALLVNSFTGLPGGIPTGITLPNGNAKLTNLDEAFVFVAKLLETYPAAVKHLSPSEISAFLSGKGGLEAVLPNIVAFLKDLLKHPAHLKSLNIPLSPESINKLESALVLLRASIEVASPEIYRKFTTQIDEILTLFKQFASHVIPVSVSGLIEGIANIGALLVNSFTGLPGGLPTGITIPTGTVKLANLDEAFVFVAKLLETYPAAVKDLSPVQISAFLSGKGGLEAVLPNIVAFLKDLLRNPAQLKSLKTAVSLESLNKLHSALTQLREVVSFSVKLTAQIDETLTLLEHFASHLFPVPVSVLIEGIANIGALLVNSFTGLPGGLPTGITIPNGNAKLTNLDEAFVFVAKLLETYPAAVKHLSPSEISAFLSGKGGLEAVLPNIVAFLKDLLRNPAQLKSLKTAVSLESLNKLHSALTQLREVVSFSVKLTAQIDETLTLLEHFASHLFPVPVSVLIEGIANIGALLVNSFTGLPGGIPTGITLPNGNAKLTNLDEAFVFVAKLLETYPAAVKHLSPSEISAFLSGKGGLEAVLPNIVAFLKDLLRNPAQLKSLKTAVSLESLNKLHSALTQLREVVSFSVKLTAQIDETLTLLEHFASHLFPVPVSVLIEGIANIGALLVNSFTGLPGGLPTGITIPNGNAKLTNLDEAFVFVAKLLETYPAAVKHLSPSEISAFLSGKGGLEAVLPNIVAFLKDLLRNPAQLKSLKTAVSLESINKLHSALTQLREVVSFSVKLTAQIDETLTLLEHFASHLFPVPVSVLIEGIANIGALLVNSFTGLPGGIPTGITLPNGNAKLTNLDEAFVFVAKLLETYPAAVKHLSPSEISAFLSGKGGLEAVLPNIVAFLKDLLKHPAHLKSLNIPLSPESINKLESALVLLRASIEVASPEIYRKFTTQIDEILTLFKQFASHVIPVSVSGLIEGIGNIGVLLVNSFTSPSRRFLSVKKWLLRKKHQIELARKRGWKGYWVCLKGTTLLFYPCDSREGRSVEAAPKHLIIVDGAIMQPIPEHPKRDYIFCLSTAFGDAYLFQAPCQVELENWVNSIHSACAAAFARHRGKTGTLHLLQEEIYRLDKAIESDHKLKHMAELQQSVVSDADTRQQISNQILQWEENLERLHCEQFRLRCYMASLQSGELPNPKSLLTHVSRATKNTLNRLGVFTVSSFHAFICARSPSLLNNLLAGRGATKRRAPLLSRSNSGSSRRSLQMSREEQDKSVKVSLPDGAVAQVQLREALSVEEFLASACARRGLNPVEHFVRVKKRRDMEDHNYFVPHRSDLIDTYLHTHEVVEVCAKILYQVELQRATLEQMWGFSVEAELMENADRQDELCCYVSRVEDKSVAMQNGIIKGDEIMVINGAIVSDLDMMYLESVLQEEQALCMMMRSSRTEPPELAGLMRATDDIIDALVCPPPPTEPPAISDDMISGLIVPAPGWNVETATSPSGDSISTGPPKVSSRTNSFEIENLLKSAEQVTGFCRSPQETRKSSPTGSIASNAPLTPSRQLSDGERLRKVLLELVDTERTYVKNLNNLLENYLEPLKRETFLSNAEINALFGNIQEIVNFQRQFLQNLDESVELEPNFHHLEHPNQFKNVLFSIGSAFLYYVNHFKLYSSFCASHSKAQKVLHPNEGNQALQEFLAARNPKQQHSSTLESYLIKPIQRILKYPLLLQQLKNLTDPNSDEQIHLMEALKGMEKVAEHINEMQRIHEEYGAIFDHLFRQHQKSCKQPIDLSPGDLLYYGGVEWLNISDFLGKIKKGLELHAMCFVFKSAVVFLCKERLRQKKKLMGVSSKSNSNEVEIIRYQVLIPVTEVQVRASSAKDMDSHFLWELIHLRSQLQRRSEKVYVLSNSTADFRNAFLKTIRQIIRESVRNMSIPTNKALSGGQFSAAGMSQSHVMVHKDTHSSHTLDRHKQQVPVAQGSHTIGKSKPKSKTSGQRHSAGNIECDNLSRTTSQDDGDGVDDDTDIVHIEPTVFRGRSKTLGDTTEPIKRAMMMQQEQTQVYHQHQPQPHQPNIQQQYHQIQQHIQQQPSADHEKTDPGTKSEGEEEVHPAPQTTKRGLGRTPNHLTLSTTSTLSAGSTSSQARLIQSSHQPSQYHPTMVKELGSPVWKPRELGGETFATSSTTLPRSQRAIQSQSQRDQQSQSQTQRDQQSHMSASRKSLEPEHRHFN